MRWALGLLISILCDMLLKDEDMETLRPLVLDLQYFWCIVQPLLDPRRRLRTVGVVGHPSTSSGPSARSGAGECGFGGLWEAEGPTILAAMGIYEGLAECSRGRAKARTQFSRQVAQDKGEIGDDQDGIGPRL